MMAIISQIWPYVLGLGGFFAALFFRQQVKTAQAQAKQEVSDVKQKEAEKQAAAAQSGANAAQERKNVENTIAATPPGDSASELQNNWRRD